jgi:hypothetical protein
MAAQAMRRNPGMWYLVTEREPWVYQKFERMKHGQYVAFRPSYQWRFCVRQSTRVDMGDGRMVWHGDIWGVYDPSLSPIERRRKGEEIDPYEALYYTLDQQLAAEEAKKQEAEKKRKGRKR